MTAYRTIDIDGTAVFHREDGDPAAATIPRHTAARSPS